MSRVAVAGHAFVVTGGGLVGIEIASQLTKFGAGKVRLIDIRDLSALIPKSVEFVQCDIADLEAVSRVMEGAHGVFHTAAALTAGIRVNPEIAARVNVQGLVNLLTAGRAAGLQKFILSSSTAVHGDGYAMDPPWPMASALTRETPFPLGQVPTVFFLYSASKLMGEALCRAFTDTHGLSTVALQYSSPYGVGRSNGATASFIRESIDRILKGEAPVIPGDGSELRDLVHVSDVAAANIAALETETPKPSYIVASGTLTSKKELAEMLISIVGARLKPAFVASHESQNTPPSLRRPYDITDTKNDLKWDPQVPLAEGLKGLFRERNVSV